jgi:hypothetical protein
MRTQALRTELRRPVRDVNAPTIKLQYQVPSTEKNRFD